MGGTCIQVVDEGQDVLPYGGERVFRPADARFAVAAQVSGHDAVAGFDQCRSQVTILAAQCAHTGPHDDQFAFALAIIISNCSFGSFKKLGFHHNLLILA
jgi:hypothetical protein